MNARETPIRSQRAPTKDPSPVVSTRSVQPPKAGIAKRLRLTILAPLPKNGDAVFDAKTFLARAGLGKKTSPSEKE